NSVKPRVSVFQAACLCFCLTITVSMLTGCEPLRKKFRREKKKDKESLGIVPVLDPVDYAPARILPEEKYTYHYTLWKAWEKELAQNYTNDSTQYSDKRQEYLIAEIIQQLGEMKGLIVEDKAKKMGEILKDMDKLQKEYEKPEDLRSRFQMRSLLKRTSRTIRDEFSPEVMKDFYINYEQL
ncbi:MAG: hypothetical protein KC618_09230, partial [Candidatus Omnitrophica bacterium]|nr:hypothetical protein [Candidatus Omnitrophota bacterium]